MDEVVEQNELENNTDNIVNIIGNNIYNIKNI